MSRPAPSRAPVGTPKLFQGWYAQSHADADLVGALISIISNPRELIAAICARHRASQTFVRARYIAVYGDTQMHVIAKSKAKGEVPRVTALGWKWANELGIVGYVNARQRGKYKNAVDVGAPAEPIPEEANIMIVPFERSAPLPLTPKGPIMRSSAKRVPPVPSQAAPKPAQAAPEAMQRWSDVAPFGAEDLGVLRDRRNGFNPNASRIAYVEACYRKGGVRHAVPSFPCDVVSLVALGTMSQMLERLTSAKAPQATTSAPVPTIDYDTSTPAQVKAHIAELSALAQFGRQAESAELLAQLEEDAVKLMIMLGYLDAQCNVGMQAMRGYGPWDKPTMRMEPLT